MEKGELWDDSALTKAFDDAISNYKKMHGKVYKHISNEDEDDSPPDANNDDESHVETIGGGNDASHAVVEAGEVEYCGIDKGNEGAYSEVVEEHTLGTNTLSIQDQSYPAVDEYNQLYKQYYEVEEQRQRILMRMQQLSSSTYTDAGEASVSGLQWSTDPAYQASQSSVSQVPCGETAVPFCPCSCSSLSCVSADACVGTFSTGTPVVRVPENLPGDVDFVKMAIGAAERAISSVTEKTIGLKEDDKLCSGMEQNVSSETDLSTVLNAWFSAGLHTGKYLTEQSLAKK